MRQPRLVKNYTRLSEQNLAFKAKTIAANLTGNPHFPVTTPSIADFTAKKDEFVEALLNCSDGLKTAIAIKNQVKDELLIMMNNLATNVQSLALNDRAKMVSSGFDLGSDGENIPIISSPTNFVILDGLNKGELKMKVKGVAGAIAYLHQYTEEPLTEESRWVSKTSTCREHLFTGLKSGKRIYGRVAVIGRKGQEVYSDVLSRIVQ